MSDTKCPAHVTVGYAAAEILGIDATRCLHCGALARVESPELAAMRQAIRDVNPLIHRPGAVFEGYAKRHYEGWAVCDSPDQDPFKGDNPFAIGDVDTGWLEGKRVRITVEVLE